MGDWGMGEMMQTRLKIALVAIGFALAALPAFAVEMPTDGSKNFNPATDAPSYLTNETLPESARVDRAESFDEEDAPEAGPAVSVGTDERHTSPRRSARRSPGKSKGHVAHVASTHHAK
jgi:hypothetical protein